MSTTIPMRFAVAKRLALLALALLLGSVFRLTGDSSREGDPWQAFATITGLEGVAAETYASLDELTAGADLVVLGRVSSVARGREWVAAPELINDREVGGVATARFAAVSISIDRVLKGTWTNTEVTYEEQVLFWSQLDDMDRAQPDGAAIFFLHFKEGPLDEGFIRLVSSTQGIVSSQDGLADVPASGGEAAEAFRKTVVGHPFDEIIRSVLAAAS